MGASPTGQNSILKYCAYATMAFSNRTENEYAATLCLTALASWTAPPRVCACIVIAALATKNRASGSFSRHNLQKIGCARPDSSTERAEEFGVHRCSGQISHSSAFRRPSHGFDIDRMNRK